jgi:hypothetical protein
MSREIALALRRAIIGTMYSPAGLGRPSESVQLRTLPRYVQECPIGAWV